MINLTATSTDKNNSVSLTNFSTQNTDFVYIRNVLSPVCFILIFMLQVSRGGQTVTLVGTSLVMFGGEDAKRSLLNDLHILDLETLTWDEIDAV